MADKLEIRAKNVLSRLTAAVGRKTYPAATEQCRELLIICAALCGASKQTARIDCPDPHRKEARRAPDGK